MIGMLYGEADPLNSSYHISYNMLLNMLRVEDADPDFLVRSSFHQYQQESSAPALEASNSRGKRKDEGLMINRTRRMFNLICLF